MTRFSVMRNLTFTVEDNPEYYPLEACDYERLREMVCDWKEPDRTLTSWADRLFGAAVASFVYVISAAIEHRFLTFGTLLFGSVFLVCLGLSLAYHKLYVSHRDRHSTDRQRILKELERLATTYGPGAPEALQQAALAEDQHPGTPVTKAPVDHEDS